MLPEGWHRSTLGDIARITSGGTPDRSEPSYWGGTVPWVTTGEIQFNTITDTAEKITEAGLKNSSAQLFPPGTLLMAMYGQGKTRGQVAKLAIEASTNQNSAAILLNEGHDPDFYFQFLWWKYDEIRDFGHSGGVSHLNAGLLKLIGVPVAPIDEQRKVARILGSWDAAIAKAQQLLPLTRRRNRSFMSNLLSGRRRLATKVRAWSFRDFDEVFERVSRKNTVGNENVLTISGEYGLISQRDFFNKSVASADLSGYTLLHRGEFAYNKSYSAGYPMGAIKPLIEHDTEPPRVLRRLQLLRRWSHEQTRKVFPGGPGAGREAGAGAPGRIRLAVGGDRLGRGQDRVYGRDAARLGSAARA